MSWPDPLFDAVSRALGIGPLATVALVLMSMVVLAAAAWAATGGEFLDIRLAERLAERRGLPFGTPFVFASGPSCSPASSSPASSPSRSAAGHGLDTDGDERGSYGPTASR